MPQFRYKAMDQYGHISRGTIQGTNIFDVESRLSSQKQDLLTCKEIRITAGRFSRRRLTRRDIINLVVQLEQLTKAGVPLLESLQDLRDSAPASYYRDVLAGLVEEIQGGKTFSEALKTFPRDFDEVFINLISVGEVSGKLPNILKDMGETLKWTDELIASTIKILIYPAIVGFVVLSVTAFLMIYLVPKIIPFVEEMGGDIPFYTLALIAVSNFFMEYWYVLVGGPFIIIVIVKILAKKNDRFRYQLHQLFLSLPIIGPISFKIKMARFANYMALLYSSGITVIRSLEICKGLVGNDVVMQGIETVKQNIAEGKKISDSFAHVRMFPPFLVRMVKVGENTGNLDEALLNVSYFLNREVKEAVDKIEPAISPILTVTMGGLLGWIMMSVLGPIWDSVSRIG